METILSKVKAQAKKIGILVAIAVLAIVGWHFGRKHAVKANAVVTSTVLAPDQKEKIIVDPTKHTLTVITKKADGTDQTITTFLPDRPTAVIEDNNGKLSLIDHKWGTELRPYLGFGYDLERSPRVNLGADLFYFHKFDLGLGLGLDPTQLKDTRMNLSLSYNFYSNTSIAFSFDNHRTPGLFLKIRF